MNDSYMEVVYVFTDIDLSCVAAIEYVIYKYGTEEWFNAALNKVVMDIYAKTRKEICHIPFLIIKKKLIESKEILLTHKGFHYIIYQIEKYKNKFGNNNNNNKLPLINFFSFLSKSPTPSSPPPPLLILPPVQ